MRIALAINEDTTPQKTILTIALFTPKIAQSRRRGATPANETASR